ATGAATTGAATTGAATTGQAEPAPAPPAAPAQPSAAAPSAGQPAHAESPAPAPAPAPEPAPEPELAVVSAAARGGLNGRSGYGAAAEPAAPAPEPEPAPDPEGLRNFVIDALERRHGDVLATLADVKAAGYTCDEAEIQRISDNHWLPYPVYRLLAQHGSTGRLVAEALRSQGIVYDQPVLDDLVRSWRVWPAPRTRRTYEHGPSAGACGEAPRPSAPGDRPPAGHPARVITTMHVGMAH